MEQPRLGLAGRGDLGGRVHRGRVELGTSQRAVHRAADASIVIRAPTRHGGSPMHLDGGRVDASPGPSRPGVVDRAGGHRRLPCRVTVPGRVRAGRTAQQLDRVRQHRHDRLERFLHDPCGRARQVHDQSAAPARPRPRATAPPSAWREPCGPHHLGEPRGLTIDHGPASPRASRRGGRNRCPRWSRPGPVSSASDSRRRLDVATLVGHDDPAAHLEPDALQDRRREVARGVARACRALTPSETVTTAASQVVHAVYRAQLARTTGAARARMDRLRAGYAGPDDLAATHATRDPPTGPLVDTFGRVADDLRISVTDRCNFRCTYCMPAEGLAWLPKDEILTFEELTRLLRSSSGSGCESIKVTGGEPTVRADLPTLVRMFREVGPELDISLTTNGVLLDTLAAPLAEAGVDRATVSCDSLLRHRFEEMTRRDALDKVLRGLRAAEDGRPHPDQDQLRRDRRHERRRGRRLRAVGARDRLRGAVHRVHAARRPARLGAAEGRPGRHGSSERSTRRTRSSPTAHGAEPATSYRFADGDPGRHRRDRERHRAVLRHVQPPAADGGGAGPQLPVRARGDRPARPDARGRVRRRARGADPRAMCGASGRVTGSTTRTSCSRRAACR